MGKLFLVILSCACLVLSAADPSFAQWRKIENSRLEEVGTWPITLYELPFGDGIGLFYGHQYGPKDTWHYEFKTSSWKLINSLPVEFFEADNPNGFGVDADLAEGVIAYNDSRERFINVVALTENDEDGPQYLQTWYMSPTGWKRIGVSNPPPRTDFSMVTTTAGTQILFGGYHWDLWGPTTYFGDTWLFNGKQWSKLSSVGPPARKAAGFAYDQKRKIALLFGGESNAKMPGSSSDYKFLNDTWTFDGKTWKRIQLTSYPSRRTNPFLFYDPLTRNVILYGGIKAYSSITGSTHFADLWVLEKGKAWKLIKRNTSANGEVIRGPLVFDTPRRRIIAFHQRELWEYQLSR